MGFSPLYLVYATGHKRGISIKDNHYYLYSPVIHNVS